MGRRHGRSTRFRIEDAAAVVASVPPDALFERCFGMPAGDASFRDVLGGLRPLRDALADSGMPTVPLGPPLGDRDFRLPAELDGDALHTALEILSRAEEIAAGDVRALEGLVDNRDEDPPETRLDRIVSQRSLGDMLRTRIGLPGWWTLPHVRTTIVNRPGAHAWKIRIAGLAGDALLETAMSVVEAIDDTLENDQRLEEVPGAIPADFGCYAIPPHGVLLRIEFARERGSYWLRSAATHLAEQAVSAVHALPRGADRRDRAGDWTWDATFSTRTALAAAMGRLGTYGRPPIRAMEIEGPFTTGRSVAIGMSPRFAGEDADELLHRTATETAA